MFGRATITLGIGSTFLVSIVSQFIYIVTVCDLYCTMLCDLIGHHHYRSGLAARSTAAPERHEIGIKSSTAM